MRTWKSFGLSILLAGSLAAVASAQTQTADQTQPQAGATTSGPVTTVNQAIDRMIAREHDEIATIRRYNPLIETYVQDMKADADMGAIPVHDHYYLGQANLIKGVVDNSMLTKKKGRMDQFNPLYHVSGLFKADFVPEGFLQMIYLDTNGFDRQHYQFDYARTRIPRRREMRRLRHHSATEIRPWTIQGPCLGGESGLHDRSLQRCVHAVSGINGYNLHFDSWRLNLQPGLWLPAFIFSQESDLRDFLGGHVRFKSDTRLWGYDLKNVTREDGIQRAHNRVPNRY